MKSYDRKKGLSGNSSIYTTYSIIHNTQCLYIVCKLLFPTAP